MTSGGRRRVLLEKRALIGLSLSYLILACEGEMGSGLSKAASAGASRGPRRCARADGAESSRSLDRATDAYVA